MEVNYDREYVANKAMQYSVRTTVDVDQIFMLERACNDEPMLRMNYFRPLPKGIAIVQCGICQVRFATDAGLRLHGMKRHREDRTPRVADAPVNPTPLTPERLKYELEHNMFLGERERATMDLPAPVEESTHPLEKSLMETSERVIRRDRSKATLDAGEGIPEINTSSEPSEPLRKKRGRPHKPPKGD